MAVQELRDGRDVAPIGAEVPVPRAPLVGLHSASPADKMTLRQRRAVAVAILACILWWGTAGASGWLRLKNYDEPASMVSGLLVPGTLTGLLLAVIAMWKPRAWLLIALLAVCATQVALVLLKWN